MSMDPQSQAEVSRILAAGPGSVTPEELAFLTARRGYLTDAQLIDFGISEPKPTEDGNEQTAPVEAKTKRSKKSAADEQGA